MFDGISACDDGQFFVSDRWWFHFLYFYPYLGEDFQFDFLIFFGWVETTNQI